MSTKSGQVHVYLCSSIGLPSLAQLPLRHGKLCVRRHRALFRLSRQSVLSGRYATTGAVATSRAEKALGADSPWCPAQGCVDVPHDSHHQGQLHDLLWGAVHLPCAWRALLRQDEARAMLCDRTGRQAGWVSAVEAVKDRLTSQRDLAMSSEVGSTPASGKASRPISA